MPACRCGYTTAQEGGGNTGFNNSLEKAANKGELYIDLVNYPVMYMGLEAMTSKYYTKDHSYSNHYRVGGVKLVLDGSPQGKTAWLTNVIENRLQGKTIAILGILNIQKKMRKSSLIRRFKINGNYWLTPMEMLQ